jgi:hypothetical protein
MMKGPQQGLEFQAAIDRASRLAALETAITALRQAMHNAEGTIDPGEHQEHLWGSREMSLAATHLEIAEFFLMKAAAR